MSKRGINKVIIVGIVGQEPNVKTFPSNDSNDNTTYTSISVATSEHWKDKNQQDQSETEWHQIVLKDRGKFKMGSNAASFLKKGSKVYIEGSLKTRKWKDKNNQDRYTTEIIANEFQVLDPKQNTNNNLVNNVNSNTNLDDGFNQDIPF